jgi:hypothetical protein
MDQVEQLLQNEGPNYIFLECCKAGHLRLAQLTNPHRNSLFSRGLEEAIKTDQLDIIRWLMLDKIMAVDSEVIPDIVKALKVKRDLAILELVCVCNAVVHGLYRENLFKEWPEAAQHIRQLSLNPSPRYNRLLLYAISHWDIGFFNLIFSAETDRLPDDVSNAIRSESLARDDPMFLHLLKSTEIFYKMAHTAADDGDVNILTWILCNKLTDNRVQSGLIHNFFKNKQDCSTAKRFEFFRLLVKGSTKPKEPLYGCLTLDMIIKILEEVLRVPSNQILLREMVTEIPIHPSFWDTLLQQDVTVWDKESLVYLVPQLPEPPPQKIPRIGQWEKAKPSEPICQLLFDHHPQFVELFPEPHRTYWRWRHHVLKQQLLQHLPQPVCDQIFPYLMKS